MTFQDKIQAKLEGILLRNPKFLKHDNETLAGFAIMGFNIPTDEAIKRIAQARGAIKIA